MTVIGLDDTDSREQGMCTTYLATRLAEAIADAGGRVERTLLVRLNPAVEHKTRGNAALAIHTDLPTDDALDLAVDHMERLAIDADSRTSPGIVVADDGPVTIPDAVADFAGDAIRERCALADAVDIADAAGYDHRGWAGDGCDVAGRGRIGALAAVGAWAAVDEWTNEQIAYRAFDRCGTPREVDTDSLFAAADQGYPTVWDTVDRAAGEAVCVPNAPGPILYGIRGDDADAVASVAGDIESEPVDRSRCFWTNQGTDSHLQRGEIGGLREGGAYRVNGVVSESPETEQGGHVFFTLTEIDDSDATVGSNASVNSDATDSDVATSHSATASRDASSEATVDCVAFEPTKRFRDRVRTLRTGDRLTVCGEYSDGTIKLEKFAVRELTRTEQVTPTCPDCGCRMASAGKDQGYRCRDCGTSAAGLVSQPLDRDLEIGWYEVPPRARRHIARPLVRGGFDAPVHPER
jgi:Predicted DNA-binding protein containing a Zn-ribbon domain